MKHQIKHLFTGSVLFECDVPDDVQASGLATRYALGQAVKDRAKLSFANLAGADLSGANLTFAKLSGANLLGANLAGADMTCANLRGADLRGGANLLGANLAGADMTCANLRGANLRGANLLGANLAGANLYGANLRGSNMSDAKLSDADLRDANLRGAKIGKKTLIGERPIFQIGPIGSRCDYFVSFITDGGVMLREGCFFGSVSEFREKLSRENGNNNHSTEYKAALDLIECHAKIWTKETSQEQA